MNKRACLKHLMRHGEIAERIKVSIKWSFVESCLEILNFLEHKSLRP